jgi:hypothetical protein
VSSVTAGVLSSASGEGHSEYSTGRLERAGAVFGVVTLGSRAEWGHGGTLISDNQPLHLLSTYLHAFISSTH